MQHASVQELKQALDAGSATVLDVREYFEYEQGHVPGAIHFPMHTIPARLSEVPVGEDVYVICQSGNRSWQVMAFLRQRGIDVINVEGGTGMWQMAGYPVTRGAEVHA